MGYYYDWLENKWTPIDHDRKRSPRQFRQISLRRKLIDDLLTEIEQGDSVTRLYAQLLVRALVSTDEILMREFGKRIATMSHEERMIQTPQLE